MAQKSEASVKEKKKVGIINTSFANGDRYTVKEEPSQPKYWRDKSIKTDYVIYKGPYIQTRFESRAKAEAWAKSNGIKLENSLLIENQSTSSLTIGRARGLAAIQNKMSAAGVRVGNGPTGTKDVHKEAGWLITEKDGEYNLYEPSGRLFDGPFKMLRGAKMELEEQLAKKKK